MSSEHNGDCSTEPDISFPLLMLCLTKRFLIRDMSVCCFRSNKGEKERTEKGFMFSRRIFS